MPRHADGPPPPVDPSRRSGRGRFCCSGCALFGALLALAFLIAFNSTGRYQPRISPPPPVPNPNALDDYIAAGILFETNGGDKPMYDANGLPSLLNQSSVVQANQPALARLRAGTTR